MVRFVSKPEAETPRPPAMCDCRNVSRENYTVQPASPVSRSAYYNSDKFVFYGEELMKRSMAYRTLLDAGVQAAAGSDFSPGPFDPRMAIQGTVTRTGWDGKIWGANQRITVEEALRVNTLNGACNSHEEARKGSITPGKLAGFVVLSDDLFTIVRTVVGAATVYQA